MLSLREFQTAFGKAMRASSSDEVVMVRDVVREGGIAFERRLDVYRNNIHASLIDALESTFPVVTRLVGVKFFRAMGREFLRAHMPERGTLVGFGGEMPRFLDEFEPVVSLPYLSDVARLELAWLISYHAVNDISVDPNELGTIPAEEMAGLRFDLHGAVQTLTSPFPIRLIWLANRRDEKPGAIDLAAGGETVLLCRPALEVVVHNSTREIAAFVEAIGEGLPLAKAAEAAFAVSEDFDLVEALHVLLAGGAFARVHRSANTNTG